MAIDNRYIAGLDLQQYLVDKLNGTPLAGGRVFFYADDNRTEPKSVYTISGDAPNYSFVALPNPIILSGVGTIQDNNGNDIIPYYLPFVVDDNGNISTASQLYYVEIYSALGVLQFTRQAWPPNAEESGSELTVGNLANYIPNGQFIVHNTINPFDNNIVSGGTTDIAPGGWQFVLPGEAASVNSIKFTEIADWTDNPPQSPPFFLNVICTTPSGSDSIKSARIRFNNVNKFANGNQYTFFFSAAANTNVASVNINVVKNFGQGGSDEIINTITNFTIDNEQKIFTAILDFGTNAGETIGPDNFCAIDIAFNVNQSFDLVFTDVMLIEGNVSLTDYSVQTDADTMARSVFGWCDIPDYDGNDLYLMPVLTPYGMKFDHSVIGHIEPHAASIPDPDTNTALGNIMPMVGSSYRFDDFSFLGIPYSRLGNFLISKSSLTGVPLWGTGPSFATGYELAGALNDIRLTLNSPGAGVPYATDGGVATGFTFTGIPDYNGSTSGHASFGYTVFNNVADTLLCIVASENADANVASGGTGFLLNPAGSPTDPNGILAYHGVAAFYLQTVAASALTNTGLAGKYWEFSDVTTDYYMWFFFTDETDPAVGGRTGIKVTLKATYTAQDVANIVRETMMAFQSTDISIPAAYTPPAGSYFLFSTNPASLENFFVWYQVDNLPATAPTVTNRTGIKVSVLTSDSEDVKAQKTRAAINAYQYFIPNLAGMFVRGYDFDAIYDLDVAQRWSPVSGVSGAVYGTFEYQQFLQHNHEYTPSDGAGAGTLIASGGSAVGNRTVNDSGGTENHPVNFGATWGIRY